MEVHFKILGWIYIIGGILSLIYGVAVVPGMIKAMNETTNQVIAQTSTGNNPYATTPGMQGSPATPSTPGTPTMPGMPTTAPQSSAPSPSAIAGVMKTVGGVAIAIIVIGSIISAISGIGILARQSWARILVIILSILSLPGIPVGTAIGIYGLWALLSSEGAARWTDYVENKPAPAYK